MPYTDALRYMAMFYQPHSGLSNSDLQEKIYQIFDKLFEFREKIPMKRWQKYNCDVAICDILKEFWPLINYKYRATCTIIIFTDLPFVNYDFKETALGHSILLWIIRNHGSFLTSVQKKDCNKTYEGCVVTDNLQTLDNQKTMAKMIANEDDYWTREFHQKLPSFIKMINDLKKDAKEVVKLVKERKNNLIQKMQEET